MDYVKLGRTGLDVSRLCLGCMSYGASDRGNHQWTLSESDSRPFIKQALDHGINFFDTANVYSDGTSEEIVGRALKDMAKRDEIVARWGDRALVAISLAMTTARMYPTLKYALGYGKTC